MLCPSCDTPAEFDAVFCGLCGRPLPVVHKRKAAAIRDTHAYRGHITAEWQQSPLRNGARIAAHSGFMPAYPLTPDPDIYEPLSEPPLHESLPERSSAPVSAVSRSSKTPRATSNDRGRYLIFIAIFLLLIGLAIFSIVFALAQHHPMMVQMSLPTV